MSVAGPIPDCLDFVGALEKLPFTPHADEAIFSDYQSLDRCSNRDGPSAHQIPSSHRRQNHVQQVCGDRPVELCLAPDATAASAQTFAYCAPRTSQVFRTN